MNRIAKLAWKCVREDGRHVVFKCPLQVRDRAERRPSVQVYTRYQQIPVHYRAAILPRRYVNMMYYRMQRGLATLFCLTADDGEMLAYAWTQEWKPFRRKYGMVAREGVLLGPDWTVPAHRGKGLHGQLLQHRLATLPPDKPVFITTAPENVASQKGIVRLGFEFIGYYHITVWFRWFVRWQTLEWRGLGSSRHHAAAPDSTTKQA